MADEEDDYIFNTAEAATHMGVHPKTIKRWVKNEHLKPDIVTPGGQYRFYSSSLNKVRSSGVCRDCKTLKNVEGECNCG
jgi:excisionase family DNA binding protein